MNWTIVGGLIGAAIAIYAMVDISMRKISLRNRMIWFPIVILIPIIGPVCYYIFRKTLT